MVPNSQPTNPRAQSTGTASFAVRTILAAGLFVVVALTVGEHHRATAAGTPDLAIQPAVSGRPPTLRDRLITGLRARLASEVAFIDGVVLAVENGRLPRRLVDQTYFWARARGVDPRLGRRRRPIIFFGPAMTARAKRLGVVL